MDISYILNHLGEEETKAPKSVVPPIFQTSNFSFNTVNELRDALADERNSYIYTRGNNPTVSILRKKLAALAQSEDALIFSSGIGAISAAVLSNIRAGDHAICIDKPYSWTEKLFAEVLPGFGVETDFVSGVKPEDFEPYRKANTRIIFLESPNTFTFEMQDIPSIARWARAKQMISLIDNSYAGPYGQPTIPMGIDIELHSASKYISGHSDLVAGVAIGSKAQLDRIFNMGFLNLGSVPSPHDAWLMLRSLRTLPIRLEQIGKNTQAVISFLKNHPKVERIHFPMNRDHEQHKLAQAQMSWCGGLFAAELKASASEMEIFCNNLKYFQMAVSWGGHESLVIPAIALSAKGEQGNIPYNLVRIYVGLEESNVLIQDLERSLELV